MIWWKILEIDYHSDLKTIKSAYAKLLKENNPEDNPEGYQRIRQAYDEAIKHEKRKKCKEQEKLELSDSQEEKERIIKAYRKLEPLYDVDDEIVSKVNPYINIKLEEDNNNLQSGINKFLRKLNEIYTDSSLREDIEIWKELMNMEAVWNVESYSILEDELFDFMFEHKYFPPKVWSLIEKNYQWTSNELQLCKRHEEKKVGEIINIIKDPLKANSILINNMLKEEQKIFNINIYNFIEKLNEIYNNKSLRVNLENWLQLMNMEVVSKKESNYLVEYKLFEFTFEHLDLPSEVWDLFETKYHWTSNALKLYMVHDNYKVREIMRIIKNPYKLNCKLITSVDDENLKEILSYRLEAYDRFITGRHIDAIELLNKSLKICSKDPEILELYGSILIKERMIKIAIVYLIKALEIDNSKILCASKIGYIYNLLKKYDEAIPYLDMYINSVQNKEKSEERVVLFNEGYAYYYNKNYEKAEYYFKESLKLGVIDEETNKLINKYLINIWKKLKGKIVRQIKPIKFSIKKSSKLKRENKKVGPIKKEGDVRRKLFFAILIFFILKAVFSINRDDKVPNQSDYIKAQQEIIDANKQRFEEKNEFEKEYGITDEKKRTMVRCNGRSKKRKHDCHGIIVYQFLSHFLVFLIHRQHKRSGHYHVKSERRRTLRRRFDYHG